MCQAVHAASAAAAQLDVLCCERPGCGGRGGGRGCCGAACACRRQAGGRHLPARRDCPGHQQRCCGETHGAPHSCTRLRLLGRDTRCWRQQRCFMLRTSLTPRFHPRPSCPDPHPHHHHRSATCWKSWRSGWRRAACAACAACPPATLPPARPPSTACRSPRCRCASSAARCSGGRRPLAPTGHQPAWLRATATSPQAPVPPYGTAGSGTPGLLRPGGG